MRETWDRRFLLATSDIVGSSCRGSVRGGTRGREADRHGGRDGVYNSERHGRRIQPTRCSDVRHFDRDGFPRAFLATLPYPALLRTFVREPCPTLPFLRCSAHFRRLRASPMPEQTQLPPRTGDSSSSSLQTDSDASPPTLRRCSHDLPISPHLSRHGPIADRPSRSAQRSQS